MQTDVSLKNQTHLKALVSAASESSSTDADVQPAASLADAKNNTLTVIAIYNPWLV